MDDQLYVLVCPEMEWEDICIYTSSERAIEESLKYPDWRVEIFVNKDGEFLPTYSYYKNGNLILAD
jgi:hypothetical protein